MKRKWKTSNDTDKEVVAGLKGKVMKGSLEHKIERRRYLGQLVNEFQDSKVPLQAKKQVLANLANFAYDPYNYDFLKELDVIHIFLEQLERASDPKLIEFALGGICNCSTDISIGRLLVKSGGIPLIKKHLFSFTNPESTISGLTSLMFLLKYDLKSEILTPDLIKLNQYANSDDDRIKNIATIFLNDINKFS